METVVRKIHFCYGHRVMNHESKCATLHGHNGVLWIHAKSKTNSLDAVGRVIDFSVIKEIIGGWVDQNWDHNMILYKEDHETHTLISKAPGIKKPFILSLNPTAENMANFLLREICPTLLKNHPVLVDKIIFYETENCYVEVTL